MTPRAKSRIILAVTVLLGLLVLAPFAWVGLVAVAILTWTPESEPARLPRMPPAFARDGATLGVEYRSAHPFLAEYDRALVVLRGDAVVARAALPRDTGGFVRLDVREAPDGTLRVEDRLGAVLSGAPPAWAVDLGAARIAPAPTGEAPGRYLGAFDRGPSGPQRFFPAEERPERPP